MEKKMKSFVIRCCQTLALPLLVYIVFYVLSKGRFGQPGTMLLNVYQSIFSIFLALGLMANMTMGMWDFSGGAVVYCAAIIGGSLAVNFNLGGYGMLFCCMLTGLLIEVVTGLLYNALKIPSLVLSIGLCMVYEALAQSVFGGQVYVTNDITFIARAPYCFVILIMGVAIMYLVINKTAFGRNLACIGANQGVSRSTGIKINKMKFFSYLIGGVFMGAAGAFMLANNATVSAPANLASLTVIFDAIMGVNIGIFLSKYCNIVFGVTIGAFTMRMLSIALVAVGLSSNMRNVITGIFLLLILCISANRGLTGRLRKRRADAAAANREYELSKNA